MEAQNKKEAAALVRKIAGLHAAISKLPSLSPSPAADALFTALVAACVAAPRGPAADAALQAVLGAKPKARRMRDELARLCSDAEACLEARCSDALAALDAPLDHLRLFPYYDNYARLSELEHALLSRHAPDHCLAATRVAFLGSGSLPLSSLLLASRHMGMAVDSYDRCGAANDRARRLLARAKDEDGVGVAARMSFRTAQVEDLTAQELAAYGVVFLAAASVGRAEDKARLIARLGACMAPGAALVVRSALGARGFLCPVVEPADVRRGGFQVLAVHHPGDDDEMIVNSVIVARKVADGGCLELAPVVSSPTCSCCCEVEASCPGKRGRRLPPPTSCHLDAMDEIRRRAW